MIFSRLAALAAISLILTVGGYAQESAYAQESDSKTEAPAAMTGDVLTEFLRAVIAAQAATLGSQNALAALQGTSQYKAYVDAGAAAQRANAVLQAIIDKNGVEGYRPLMDGTWQAVAEP
jgi:hypothetical protein